MLFSTSLPGMSDEVKKEIYLEVAHVLFMDVVGFSKLLIDDQSEILEQLNQLSAHRTRRT